MRVVVIGVVLALTAACSARHRAAALRPPPVTPVSSAWVDLHPQMDLRIENAYYREGAPKHGLEGFLGTQTARYQKQSGRGLRLVSVESALSQRPADQPPVQDLIARSQTRYREYRFFYAIIFNRKGGIRGSVLLGAGSASEIDHLTDQLLSHPDSICVEKSRYCTVFPEACSVSVEVEIVVNSAPRTVVWGSQPASVAPGAHHIAVLRRENGRVVQVGVDAADPRSLRLQLLPGDQITWD